MTLMASFLLADAPFAAQSNPIVVERMKRVLPKIVFFQDVG